MENSTLTAAGPRGILPNFPFHCFAFLQNQHLIIWIQLSNFHVSIVPFRIMASYKNSALFYDDYAAVKVWHF